MNTGPSFLLRDEKRRLPTRHIGTLRLPSLAKFPSMIDSAWRVSILAKAANHQFPVDFVWNKRLSVAKFESGKHKTQILKGVCFGMQTYIHQIFLGLGPEYP